MGVTIESHLANEAIHNRIRTITSARYSNWESPKVSESINTEV